MRKRFACFLLVLGILIGQVIAREADVDVHQEVLFIHSTKQQLLAEDQVVFQGDVEILLDGQVHLWADRVIFDKRKKTLLAEQTSGGPVSIQIQNFFIVVDRIFFDISTKTGHADNIRLHITEGYISARHLEKKSAYEWVMSDMSYTSCCKEHAHWRLTARRAKMQGPYYFVRVSDAMFKVGSVPIFLVPYMTFPIQNQSRSGFLIPKFYLDYQSGFGFTQEYYLRLAAAADTTLGVNWRHKKGVVFSDEFRWARSLENYTFLHGYWAIEQNSLVQRGAQVINGTRHRYWLDGCNIYPIKNIFGGDIYTLTRVDFGTDKGIGYKFYEDLENLENSFFNSLILRLWRKNALVNVMLDYTKTERKLFTIVDEGIQENNNITHFALLPQVSWHTSSWFYSIFSYRHDVFSDQLFYDEQEMQQIFVNRHLVNGALLVPLIKKNLIRFNYQGSAALTVPCAGGSLSYMIQPVVQGRSKILRPEFLNDNVIEQKIFAAGSSRFFACHQTHLTFPEIEVPLLSRGNGTLFIQPTCMWNYIPKFRQEHWFYADQLDRYFPQNSLSCSLNSYLFCERVSLNTSITQSYDFYSPTDILPLRRALSDIQHLLPLSCNVDLALQGCAFSLGYEFDIPKKSLLTSYLGVHFSRERCKIGFGYLYQHDVIQQKRNLLSDIPHFLLIDASIPVGKAMSVHYDGQFYDEFGIKGIFRFSRIRPLLHRFRVDYQGHCWGLSLGYEEKFYRELGNRRSERALVFSIRLDSLGSFAKRFKQPAIIRESEKIHEC